MVNKRIGSIDNRLRRAIIALQLEELGVGIAVLKSKDIAYIGSAEGIDGLRVIPDYADIILRLGELFDNEILRIVGVLILIDQHILKNILIVAQRLRVLMK